MAELHELSLPLRLFLKAYPWRRLDPIPWAPIHKMLAQSRVALVTTAGFSLPDQPPFEESVRGGDVGYRWIPDETDPTTLVENHRSSSFDHAGIRSDPELAFPIGRLHSLVAAERIGATAPRHLSFMGSITAPGRLTRDSAPLAAAGLVEDQVDLALLVPV